jgi:hypothetical protein
MSRVQRVHQDISIHENGADSIDCNSISDSNYESSTCPSANDNFLSDLATMTLQSVFEPSVNIVGRSKEISILINAFYLTCCYGKTERERTFSDQINANCLSGSGKTTLVEHLLRHITTKSQGFFVMGKYDATAGVREPYAAILEAFSDL